MTCRCGKVHVDVRQWSVVVRGQDSQNVQQNALNDLPSIQAQAQLRAPIVWRVFIFSSLPGSLVPGMVEARLYSAGGALTEGVPVASGDELVGHGVSLYVPALDLAPTEMLYLALAPASWPNWLVPGPQCGE